MQSGVIVIWSLNVDSAAVTSLFRGDPFGDPQTGCVVYTITGVNITNHNHVSNDFSNAQLASIGAAPNAGPVSVTESPFFALAAPSGGLSGDLGFNNNPNVAGAPATAATATLSGSFTIVGNSTAGGGFIDGNSLPTGVTATYDLSFGLSTTTGALLSAGAGEGNGLGAGNGDAFFAPTNGNFSGNLVFGAATISGVSFSGAPVDSGFVFSNGSVDSVDLLGLASQSFSGTNDAILTDAAGNTLVDFATSVLPGQVLLDITNDNLFEGQELGDAIFAITNGGGHLRGFTLGTNFSFDVTAVPEPSSFALLGLMGMGLGCVRRRR